MLELLEDDEYLRRLDEQSQGTTGAIPQALADAFARAGVSPPNEAAIGRASSLPAPMDARAAALASMPELTALPERRNLTAERDQDAEARFRRGMERAAKTVIRAFGPAPRPVQDEDLVTQLGTAEASALRDEARARDDVMAQRQAQMQERQRVLSTLLRPGVDSQLEREKLDVRRAETKSLDDFRKGSLEARGAETARRKAVDEGRAKRSVGGGAAAALKAKLAEEKAARATAKDERERVEGLAAGWELAPDSTSTKRQREEHAGLVKSAKKMRGLTQTMRQQMQGVDAVDRLNPLSEKRNQLRQLATMISIEAKNIAELGALSGPDYALMQAIAADPTSLQSLTKDQMAVLDQLDRWSDNSVKAMSESIGARPKASEATSPADSKVRVRRLSDGVVKPVSKATADALVAKGGFEVVP